MSESGSGFSSAEKAVNTTLPAGSVTFQVLGAVAELERELLCARVKAGMAQARRARKNVGRPMKRKLVSSEIEK
jgi:DNA invertase Pin-like site-specific DNA recombinase